MEYYFIYGTLKDGMKNNYILDNMDAEYICECNTVDYFPMFDIGDGFPYLQDPLYPGVGEIVKGELWGVNKLDEASLDRFEGVPSLYKRGKIDVDSMNGVYTDVNVYFKAKDVDLSKVKFINEWKE